MVADTGEELKVMSGKFAAEQQLPETHSSISPRSLKWIAEYTAMPIAAAIMHSANSRTKMARCV